MNKPKWWPENPYPKTIVTTMDNAADAIIASGMFGRTAWNLASETIWKAVEARLETYETTLRHIAARKYLNPETAAAIALKALMGEKEPDQGKIPLQVIKHPHRIQLEIALRSLIHNLNRSGVIQEGGWIEENAFEEGIEFAACAIIDAIRQEIQQVIQQEDLP